jgi:hypothetical protein
MKQFLLRQPGRGTAQGNSPLNFNGRHLVDALALRYCERGLSERWLSVKPELLCGLQQLLPGIKAVTSGA